MDHQSTSLAEIGVNQGYTKRKE